jgi:cell division septum initiation protein DivIVA
MNISEFAKPVTAKSLNESLARRYKTKINLESYTLSQLQNARNILRTKLSQVEVSESFSTVIESESYQKSKLMLDILNAAISERGDIDAEVLEAAKPDYIDIDGDGDTEEPMKKAVKDKEKKKKNESIVKEGAEDQAEIVMAAKEMVDRLTGWMEDVAEMKTESMLELADAIRDEMGSQQSQAWLDTIKPGLEELYAAMEVTRGSLSNGVGMLTGEGEVTPPTEMGADEMGAEMPADDAAMEPTVDMEAGGDESFATAAPAAGGAEEAGRPARESIERKVKRESIDSRKLATKLASSKKK